MCPVDNSAGYCRRNVPLGMEESERVPSNFLKVCQGKICSQSDLAPKPMPEQSQAASAQMKQKKSNNECNESKSYFFKSPCVC